jgi:hypothetical protein
MANMTDELGRVDVLRRQRRLSGLNEWDYAVMVLRVAAALAGHRGESPSDAASHTGGVAARLAPNAWPLIQEAAESPSSAVREALEEMGVRLSADSHAEDPSLSADVATIVREAEVRRSALVSLSGGNSAQVLVLSHPVPFIPEIYTGLCLLNRVLLDTAMEAGPDHTATVLETIEERVQIRFGRDIDAAAWRTRLAELWRQRLRDIFSDQAEERFGPLANVLLFSGGGSKRAPLDYIPRPLLQDFRACLQAALLRRREEAQPGIDPVQVEEAYQSTREWLDKNWSKAGYGKPARRTAGGDALTVHPASRLVDAIGLGAAVSLPAPAATAEEGLCIYCGSAAESIETPKMAEGSGVKKFSKRWIATGKRKEARLCARCSLASFLQLRRLGCYSQRGSVGPKRFFTVYHEGVYPRSRLEFLKRWSNAYYTLLREGNLIRQLGSDLRQGPNSEPDDAGEASDPEGTTELDALDIKGNLKRLRRALEEIQANAADLRHYLQDLRDRLPDLSADVGISPDDIGALADQLEDALESDPTALNTYAGARVKDLLAQLLKLDAGVASTVARPILDAFRRRLGDSESGLAVYDLGGTVTSRLLLLALPVLPQVKKGSQWIDLSRHFSASRAAVTLTLGWLQRRFPGTYWWGVPIASEDGLIHTPYGVTDPSEIAMLEAAWTIASRIVPPRRVEYPQLLAWAEKLVEEPMPTMARILRQQGDTRPSVRRLDVNQLAKFVQEVAIVGAKPTDAD